ncbi:MAG: PLD nuclease N-terminal domain-containing protein [Carbonactinosporaceae bacterium]
MLRALFFLVPLVLAVFALVDCIQADEAEIRHLPRAVWMPLILLLWVIGPILWLVAGRARSGGPSHGGYRRPTAPDDDPDFLDRLRRRRPEPPEA